jgi:3-phenylpropionate/trans-cinnamate dioxygenase ferredoxin subunit
LELVNIDDRWIQIAALEDFAQTSKLTRNVEGQCILLCQLASEIVAVRNVCTHLEKPLDSGRVMAGHITCPYHGASFNLRTGFAASGPAVAPLQTYPVKIQDGQVFVLLR